MIKRGSFTKRGTKRRFVVGNSNEVVFLFEYLLGGVRGRSPLGGLGAEPPGGLRGRSPLLAPEL